MSKAFPKIYLHHQALYKIINVPEFKQIEHNVRRGLINLSNPMSK